MKALATTIQRKLDGLKSERALIRVLKDLPDSDGIENAYGWMYGKQAWVSLDVKPESLVSVTASMLRRLKVKTATKSLNASSGKVETVIDTPKVRLTIAGSPVRCKLRKVIKQTLRPAVAEHYEDVVSYEIENPEECLGTPHAL